MLNEAALFEKLEQVKASREAVKVEVERMLKNLNAHDGAVEMLESLIASCQQDDRAVVDEEG